MTTTITTAAPSEVRPHQTSHRLRNLIVAIGLAVVATAAVLVWALTGSSSPSTTSHQKPAAPAPVQRIGVGDHRNNLCPAAPGANFC